MNVNAHEKYKIKLENIFKIINRNCLKIGLINIKDNFNNLKKPNYITQLFRIIKNKQRKIFS